MEHTGLTDTQWPDIVQLSAWCVTIFKVIMVMYAESHQSFSLHKPRPFLIIDCKPALEELPPSDLQLMHKTKSHPTLFSNPFHLDVFHHMEEVNGC